MDDNFAVNKSIGKYFGIISRNMHYYMNKQFQFLDLRYNEAMVLIHIDKNKNICQEDLVKILKKEKTEIAKIIKKLMDKEYIYKIKDKKDKRIHRLYLTEKFEEIKEKLIEILKNNSKILSKNLTDKELDFLFEILEKISENIVNEANIIREQD
ncbi:MarR family winged helix-turn-helix transcriptional regulator [Peptostreptococcaceae bacterium AGR-M142]